MHTIEELYIFQSPSEWFWLGISRKKNGKKWKSYNASLLYSNWDEEKPSNVNRMEENCGVMVDSGKWNAFVCEEAAKPTSKVLCEKKIEIPQKGKLKLICFFLIDTRRVKNV